jgi:AhpD family alkylhydroperoxidase
MIVGCGPMDEGFFPNVFIGFDVRSALVIPMTDMNAQFDEAMHTMGTLKEQAPDLMGGFGHLHEAVSKDGALSGKMKEAIALGIAIKAQCVDCIAFHTKMCVKAGYSKEEILEIGSVAVLMGGGPALMYMHYVLEALEQYIE